ncbi:acyltransferase [Thermosipho melanesiensis]|uniref:Acyltransferase 3 domain-containing protein n=2 Tax=Thermosipho melanesiensis TaxID=46541 RepID=A6LJ46_THEM4|nr:acyltransferase family protein [Thermosipho melanesiensis]ABR29947.1 hypothetical protein Tmel_0070 [Thermosipho melanesiensis BI429]APT73153.1 acyltransferase [Thermosipho melanesiensis]OOC38549.1 acyltransferase [Thermosipho melanesiensis]OOC40353.1 acyltransferase [Thermosipho melanesiensis]OOC40617.1 acyltransferase [Thermosipho melanesiensis]
MIKSYRGGIIRIKELDIAKGILIIMVMFAHSCAPENYVAKISSILAVFMLISGYLYKDEMVLVKLKKLFLNILIPFYFMSTVGYFVYYFINRFVSISDSVFSSIFDFLFFGYSPIDMPVNVLPLWYLYMFFVAELCFLVLYKLKLVHLIPVLSFFSTLFIKEQSKFFKLEVVFHGLVWFYLGFIFKKNRFGFRIKRKYLLFSFSFLLLWIFSNINGFNDWRSASYGKFSLLSYFTEFLSIILIVSLSNILVSTRFENFFVLFGRFTIFVLGYHILIPGLLTPLVSDPIAFVSRFWYIYYLVSIFIMYLVLKIFPKWLIYTLAGQFHLIRGNMTFIKKYKRRS